MFYLVLILMFLDSIALPRFTNLQTPRTDKVLEPVPHKLASSHLAFRFMPAARINASTHPKHLLL